MTGMRGRLRKIDDWDECSNTYVSGNKSNERRPCAEYIRLENS